MDVLGKSALLSVLSRLKTIMEENKDYLINLDSQMGDADLGLTMTKAFSAAADELQDTTENDLGKILMRAGMLMARAAPSTMGTLIATGFMRGGKSVSGKSELTVADLAEFFKACVQGIMDRGKSRPGEKTIIDSLKPAADALADSTGKEMSLAMADALEAAEKGLEATKDMVAQHGRIDYYKEKSKGNQDPGATVGVLIVKGFSHLNRT